MIDLTSENFDKELSDPMVVLFWAEGDIPSSRAVAELSKLIDIKTGKVDVYKEPRIAMRFGIVGIPQLMFFMNRLAMVQATKLTPAFLQEVIDARQMG